MLQNKLQKSHSKGAPVRAIFPQTKNTALCPTLLHLDASSPLGIIGTKLVASNSSQQSLVPEGSLVSSGGFSSPKRDVGSSRGIGGRGGRVGGGEGTLRGGGQAAGSVGVGGGGGQGGNQEVGARVGGGGGLVPTRSTKSSWRFSRTTSGPSTTTLDPLRADLDSVLSAVIRRIKAEEEKKNGGKESGRWYFSLNMFDPFLLSCKIVVVAFYLMWGHIAGGIHRGPRGKSGTD